MRAEPRPLTGRQRLWLSIGRALDKWLTPLGVWIYRRTRGGITRPWHVDALLLTPTGRRSKRQRTVVLQFFPDGAAMILAAANDGGANHPGWYDNLKAAPGAQVEVMGQTVQVRAEELAPAEASEWWGRVLRQSPGYERYARATTRTIPIIRLVPAA